MFDIKALGSAGAGLLMALAAAVQPPEEMSLREWSEGRIVIPAEANTPRPGPLSWDGYEYCIEPLERLNYKDGCSRVALMAAAQTGKSNIGVVWFGWTVVVAPRPMGLAVPSGPKAYSFNSKKLQPVIDKTAALSERIVPQNSRDDRASTQRQKNYPGGSLTIFSAGSVSDLQGESFGAVWMTETPNYAAELAGRGSPLSQIRSRMDGWSATGTKELHESTPGEEGACPISAAYDSGDRRRWYLPCPHCDQAFVIEWEDFVVPEDATEEPYVSPPCCGDIHGAVILERDLPAMKRAALASLLHEQGDPRYADFEPCGGYLPTFPSLNPDNPAPGRFVPQADIAAWRARPTEGRQPSYHFWQVVSPQKTWSDLAQDWRDARGKPTEEAAFRQQKLGLPTESAMKAPPATELLSAAQILGSPRGVIPPGTCWLTGTADIQGDRIEWRVSAHGPHFRARIDRGVIDHDPLGIDAWVELAKVLQHRWEGPHVRPLGIDAFGVDLGGIPGATPRVYEFVRGRQNCYAIKGSSRDEPLPTNVRRIKGKDTRGRTISVSRLMVDTYVFKKALAYGLTMLVKSARLEPPQILPGAVLFEDDATEEDFKQLTAERFSRAVDAKPGDRGAWEQHYANEQTDLDVYDQALAYQKGVTRWDAGAWERLFLARSRDPQQEPSLPLLDIAAAPHADLPTNTAKTPTSKPAGGGWYRRR